MNAELPELPKSFGDHCVTDSVRTMREPGYTADQMRAYGKACVAELRALAGAEGGELVAEITGMDEYGPMLSWHKHWVDAGIGTKLYAKGKP